METEKNGGLIFLQRELLVQVFSAWGEGVGAARGEREWGPRVGRGSGGRAWGEGVEAVRGEREWRPRVGRGSGGRAWGEGVEAARGEREWKPCVGRGSGGGYLIWLCHGGGTVSR